MGWSPILGSTGWLALALTFGWWLLTTLLLLLLPLPGDASRVAHELAGLGTVLLFVVVGLRRLARVGIAPPTADGERSGGEA